MGDNSVYQSVLYSAALKTIGQNTGTVIDLLANGTETLDSIFAGIFGANTNAAEAGVQALPDLFEGFTKNLQAGIASALGSAIVEELGDVIEIDGVAGEVFDVAAGVVTTGFVNTGFNLLFEQMDPSVYANLISSDFEFGKVINPDAPIAEQITLGEQLQAQIFNAVAAYAGSRLAGEIVEAENEFAAVFGSIGSTYAGAIGGAAVASGAVSLSFSSALSTIAAAGLSWAPIIGTAIGAFVGQVAGTLLGNAFGGGADTPNSWGRIEYDPALGEYKLLQSWGSGGGTDDIGESMALQTINGINAILDATHGKLRTGSGAPYLQVGLRGDAFEVMTNGGAIQSFGTAADAVNYAAFSVLKGFDLVAGHAVVMRAWHNSDATNIHEFKDDIEVAEAFQLYLSNPAGILALMMDQPESDTAQAWAAILQRVNELELHLPHEKDLDGGWNEVLLAQGVDPSFIPALEGDSIVLTDPVTGEETVIHHVIGPGYEIVRIEGTDGNDIIEVIVDGESITYVAAGEGDDTIVGSDDVDILVGGGGDDTIIGNDGNDWLHGGSGADNIDGGLGEDLIVGADDNDYLVGGEDIDTIYGNGGDDYLNPGMGVTDYLFGGDGDDILEGNVNYTDGTETHAYINGEGGNDHLILWDHDNGNGDEGNDTIEFAGSSSIAWITRGEGHDTIIASDIATANVLRFDKTISPNELYFRQIGDDLEILVLGEKQSVTVKDFYGTSNVPDLVIEALDSSTILHTRQAILNLVAMHATMPAPTGEYNYLSDADLSSIQGDVYTAWTVYNAHAGGAGSQGFGLTSGTAYGIGGAGNDNIIASYSPGHKVFAGDSGDDILTSTGGQIDIMSGGFGDDRLDAGGSNDILYGGHGDDILNGGHQDDELRGGHGNDYLSGGHHNDIVYGDDGDDFIFDHDGDNTIYGGLGNDTIDTRQNLNNDFINGDEGADVIKAGDGDDTIDGGDDDDYVNAGGGNDWVHGGLGADSIAGGNGFDVLNGGVGNDNISGNAEDDVLYGELGNDVLEGGIGNDTLYGGDGDDTYHFSGFDRSILFNENDSTGKVQLDNVIMPTDAITVSMMFRNKENYIPDDMLFHYASGQQNDELKIYNNTAGLYILVAGNEYATGYPVTDSEWHDLTLSWNGVTGDLELYDNGVLVYSHTQHAGTTLNTGGVLMIGQNQDSLGNSSGQYDFEGEVTRFTIWDHALSGSEIVHGADTSDALHDFDFDDGQGSVAQNNTGNGDGVLSGDILWQQEEPVTDSYVALNKTGNTGRVQLDNATMGANAITISMTFKNEYAVTDDHLFHYAAASQHHVIKFYNNPSYAYMDINGVEINTGYGGFQGTDWQTMTLSWDAATGDVALYDDGVQVFTTQLSPGATIASGGTLMLGQYQDWLGGTSGGYDFDGDLAEFVVWDHVLDANEISSGVDKTDALHNFQFTDGQGATVTNEAGNGDASLSGDFIWHKSVVLTDEAMAEQLGLDIISDTSGNDTISFGNNITIDKLSFERDFEDQDDLIIKLLGSEIAVVENQFSDGAIETLLFEDASVIAINTLAVSLSGDSTDNTLEGTEQNDTIYGLEGNDVLWGGLGVDTLSGGQGADTFVFESAHLDGNVDVITDFSVSEGDVLDVSSLIEGYDPVTDAISDFIQITDNGTDSILSVDADGGADNFVQVAELSNVTGLTDENNLETNGTLITV